MLSRFITAACSGITSERNTIISSSAQSSTTTPMNSGSLWPSTVAKSTAPAVTPPTYTVMPVWLSTGGTTVSRRRGDELRGGVGLRRGVGVDGDRGDVAGGIELGRGDRHDARGGGDGRAQLFDRCRRRGARWRGGDDALLGGFATGVRHLGDDQQRAVEALAEALREQLVGAMRGLAWRDRWRRRWSPAAAPSRERRSGASRPSRRSRSSRAGAARTRSSAATCGPPAAWHRRWARKPVRPLRRWLGRRWPLHPRLSAPRPALRALLACARGGSDGRRVRRRSSAAPGSSVSEASITSSTPIEAEIATP